MKTLNNIITVVLMMAGLASWSGAVNAVTGPSIDQLNVQGYMKKANGTAITDGTYNMAFGVFQNGSPLWCGIQSVTTLSGLFSATLSGIGSDCSAIPAGTAMNQNYSAGGLNKTLNPALLSAATTGEVSVVVYSVDPINGSNPQFTMNIGAVPTAFVADTAKQVVAGSITYASVAAGAKTLVSTGAANIFPVTDATGKLDISVIPAIPLGTNVSGITPIANGGTGQSSAPAALAALGGASRGSNTDITSLAGLTTALSVAQGGSNNAALGVTAGGVVYTDGSKFVNTGVGVAGRVLLSAGAGAPTWGFPALNALGAAASGANTDITSLAGLTTVLSLGQGGTGGNTATAARTSLSAAALGSNNDITAITGLTTALALTQGGTGNLTLANAAGGVLYTDGTMVQNTGLGVAGKVLVSAGAGVPVWGNPPLAGIGAAARGSNTDISSLGFAGAFSVINSGFLTLNPTGALTLGGANTTRINLGTSVYNMTLPSTQGALNSILTNDGSGNLSWASITTDGAAAKGSNTDLTSLNPTANLTIGDAGTTGLSLIPNGNISLAPIGGRTISIGGAGSTGVSIQPSSGNAGILMSASGSGNLTIGAAASTGSVVIGNSGAGSVTSILSGTGNLTIGGANVLTLPSTSFLITQGPVATGDLSITTTNNKNLSLFANGSGNLTLGSGAGTGTVILGNLAGTATTQIQSGTGNLTIAGANLLTLPSTSFLITQGPAATGDLSISTTNNKNMFFAPNGSGGLSLGSAAGTGTVILGNAGGTASTLLRSGSGNLTVAGANALTLPATSFLITQAAGATGDLSITTTNNNNVSIVPNGTGVLSVNGFVEWTGQSRVTIAFTKTSSIVLGGITGLSANLQAGKTYYFDIQLYTTSNVGGGLKVDLNGGTATAANIIGDAISFDAGAVKTQTRIAALNTSICAITAVTVANCHITGTITTTGAGTFIPEFAQNASNAAASTVAVGSTMIIQQIN